MISEELRSWRRRRGVSQFDLALRAGTTQRHVSFIESGRSRPGRAMVIRLAESLEVPLRERNELLLTAGYAPAYEETRWDDGKLGPVRAALDSVLRGHEPYPAVAVNRHGDLVSANEAFRRLTAGVAAELLTEPVNIPRLLLHPRGLAPRIVNFDTWAWHVIDSLRRRVARTPDDRTAALVAELVPLVPARVEHPDHLLCFPPLGVVILVRFGKFADYLGLEDIGVCEIKTALVEDSEDPVSGLEVLGGDDHQIGMLIYERHESVAVLDLQICEAIEEQDRVLGKVALAIWQRIGGQHPKMLNPGTCLNMVLKERVVPIAQSEPRLIDRSLDRIALLEHAAVQGCCEGLGHVQTQCTEQERQGGQTLLPIHDFGLRVVLRLDQHNTSEEVRVGGVERDSVGRGGRQVIEHLAGLLGCPSVRTLISRDREAVLVAKDVTDGAFSCLDLRAGHVGHHVTG